jgi:plastocyanin
MVVRLAGPLAALLLAVVSVINAIPRQSADAATVQHTVYMKNHGADNYVYAPATLKVRIGTKVVWRNTSSAPHSITPLGKQRAFSEQAAKDIEPKHAWSFSFRHAGTFTYYCIFHPYMKAKVIVHR